MIHFMMTVRNEKSRELNVTYGIFKSVLINASHLSERLVLIDDNSSDDTLKFLNSVRNDYKFVEVHQSTGLWDKDEVTLRKQLWGLTTIKATHGDWIVCLDADEILHVDIKKLKNMMQLLPRMIDGIGFRLFDMWNLTHYREDEHWKAHMFPWCFAVRYDEKKEYVWHEKALHCGRFPANASERMLPTEIPVKHYGWALEEDRKKKYERYMRIDGDGKHGILAQYQSILDENPRLIEYGSMGVPFL